MRKTFILVTLSCISFISFIIPISFPLSQEKNNAEAIEADQRNNMHGETMLPSQSSSEIYVSPETDEFQEYEPNAKEWTFMVYMTADNNLDQASLDDLNEMEAAGSNHKVNIIALADREGPGNTTLYYVIKENPSTPEIVSFQAENSPFPLELNMGDPENLIKFVNWSVKNFPARRYALVLWGHGLGWKGVGFDENSGNDPLTPSELNAALTSIKKSSGLVLDIVAFDACLMQMAELGIAVSKDGLANYIIGSQESVPGPGWNYEKVISSIEADPSQDSQSLATRITDIYMEMYPTDRATLSAIKLSSLYGVKSAMDDISDSLSLNKDWKTISAARKRTQEFNQPSYIDLLDFTNEIRALVPDENVLKNAERLHDLLTTAIISNRKNSTHPYAHGLSVYFPSSGKPDETYTDYTIDSFRWYRFLVSYSSRQK